MGSRRPSTSTVRWTLETEQRLAEMKAARFTNQVIAEQLGCSRSAVANRWLMMRRRAEGDRAPIRRHRWTEAEDKIVRSYAARSNGWARCAKRLGRSVDAVVCRAAVLRKRSQVRRLQDREAARPWTRPDEQRLLEMRAQGKPIRFIARALGRTLGAIRQRLAALDPGSKPGHVHHPWTAAEDDELRRLWPVLTCAEIGARLGRSASSVACRARRLGLPRKRGTARRSPW